MTAVAVERLPMHDAQVPAPGQLNLDHVAHFVPDRDAAATALEQLGFTLTPFSEQSHRLERDGPLVPAGTGNRCVMLREGYLEFLTPFADTPVADQLRESIRRYVGVHLIAYGTPDADADFARLDANGFKPLTPVRLQREAQTATGTTTVRFVVTRTAPGTMPEGRIQFCGHQTPEGVWQLRWIEHANRAAGLRRVFLCVDDPAGAARRYAAYTGIATDAVARDAGCEFIQRPARGTLHLMDADAMQAQFGLAPPTMPWIAGYELASDDLAITRAVIDASGMPTRMLADGRLLVVLPPALGGFMVFSAIAPA
jgi:hypothetical protein